MTTCRPVSSWCTAQAKSQYWDHLKVAGQACLLPVSPISIRDLSSYSLSYGRTPEENGK